MKLTDEQEAVIAADGRMTVVLAGPGSGKTTTITELITRLNPEQLKETAILTFTTAAAGSIRAKLNGVKPMFAGNIHSYCFVLLNREGIKIGLKPKLSVLSEDASSELLGECMEQLSFNGDPAQARAECVRNPKVEQNPQPRGTKQAFDVAMLYHQRLIEGGMLDFDSFLSYGLHLIKRGAFWIPKVLLIDETQDSSPIEWEIYKAMNCHRNVVVGDLDQSIYEWRGAVPEKLLSICKKAPDVIRLITRNHRSGPVICEAATNLIANNFDRISKPVVSAYETGGEIIPRTFKNRDFELDDITAWAKEHVGKECAILCRWNKGCAQVKKPLEDAGIKIQGRTERPKRLNDALAYLYACNDPGNDQLVYMWLKKKLGKKYADHWKSKALQSLTPIALTLDVFLDEWITVKGNSISIAVPESERLSFMIGHMDQFGDDFDLFAEEIMLALDDEASIGEFIAAASEEIELTKGEGMPVMTIHKAKGLEWDDVLLPFWTEGCFPGRMSEEERRLAFVAVTRAKKKVVITSSLLTPIGDGQAPKVTKPSRFIGEMKL